MSSVNESPKKRLWILDRIEEGTAVMICEDGTIRHCPPPSGAREGDVFEYTGEDFIFLPDETSARMVRIRKRMNELFR